MNSSLLNSPFNPKFTPGRSKGSSISSPPLNATQKIPQSADPRSPRHPIQNRNGNPSQGFLQRPALLASNVKALLPGFSFKHMSPPPPPASSPTAALSGGTSGRREGPSRNGGPRPPTEDKNNSKILPPLLGFGVQNTVNLTKGGGSDSKVGTAPGVSRSGVQPGPRQGPYKRNIIEIPYHEGPARATKRARNLQGATLIRKELQNTPSDDGESGLLSIVDSPALNTTQHEPDSANTRTTGRNKSTVAKTPNKTKPRQNRFKTPESTVPASRLPEIISLLDDWENDDSPYSTPGHDPKLLAPSQQTSRASTKKRSMEIPRNSEGGGTQIGPSLSKDDYEEKFLNSFLDGPSFPNSSKMLADINNSSKRAQIQGHRRTMTRTDSQVTTRPEDDCQFITPTPAPRQIRKFQNLQQAGEDSDHLTDYPAQNNGRIIPHVVEGTIPVPMPNLPPELPASMPISGEQHLSMALTHLTSEKKVVERKLLASTTELQARKAELGSLISTNQNLKVELEKYKGAVPSLKSQIQELKQVIAGINSNCTSLDETALAIQEELKECSHERLIIRREIQQERYALGIIERKLLDYKEPTAILKELEMEKDNALNTIDLLRIQLSDYAGELGLARDRVATLESLLVKNQDFREGIFAAIGEFKQELILKLQDLKNKFAESNNERDIKARKSDSKLDELAFSVLSKGEAILKKVKILDRVLRAVERNSNRVDGKLDVIIEEGARLYGNIDESRKEIEMKLEGGFVSTLNKLTDCLNSSLKCEENSLEHPEKLLKLQNNLEDTHSAILSLFYEMNGMHADAVDWSEKYAMHLKEENKEFSEELQILRGRSEDLVALQIHKIHVDMELEVALEDSKRMTNELEDFKIRDQTQVEQIASLKKELEAVNCKLAEKAIAEAFGAEHGQLKRAFEELSGQFQDQTQLLELKNDELVRVQKHYDELKATHTLLQGRVDAFEEEKKIYVEKVEREQKAERITLENTAKRLRDNAHYELQNKIKNLESENKTLKGDIKSLQSQKELLAQSQNSEVERLHRELEKLQLMHNEIRSEMKIAYESLEKAKEDNSALVGEKVIAVLTHTASSQRITELEEQVEHMMFDISKQIQQLDSPKTQQKDGESMEENREITFTMSDISFMDIEPIDPIVVVGPEVKSEERNKEKDITATRQQDSVQPHSDEGSPLSEPPSSPPFLPLIQSHYQIKAGEAIFETRPFHSLEDTGTTPKDDRDDPYSPRKLHEFMNELMVPETSADAEEEAEEVGLVRAKASSRKPTIRAVVKSTRSKPSQYTTINSASARPEAPKKRKICTVIEGNDGGDFMAAVKSSPVSGPKIATSETKPHPVELPIRTTRKPTLMVPDTQISTHQAPNFVSQRTPVKKRTRNAQRQGNLNRDVTGGEESPRRKPPAPKAKKAVLSNGKKKAK